MRFRHRQPRFTGAVRLSRRQTLFFGEQSTSLDAIAYGLLTQLIRVPLFTAPIFQRAKSYQNLVDYTERFHNTYFNLSSPAIS
jgi:hypothetical protein